MDKAWIDIKELQPVAGSVIIAAGTWCGEINWGGHKTVILGKWDGRHVNMESDAYGTWLDEVTHWMPAPKLPEGDNAT